MSEKTTQLSPKAIKAALILSRVTANLIVNGMAAVTYAVAGLLITLGLNYGFGLHIQWYGLAIVLFFGMLTAKIVLKDLSYSHGKASYEGQLAAMAKVLAKAAAQTAQQQQCEAEAGSLEEQAIRRAMEKFNRPDDPPMNVGGPYL